MPAATKRGRPLKYGRPSRLVAVTLPTDVVDQLRRTDADMGRAIVAAAAALRTQSAHPEAEKEAPIAELTRTRAGFSLILVNQDRLPSVPGVLFVPVTHNRALLALERNGGLAELELAVRDAVAVKRRDTQAHRSLKVLARAIREWRTDVDVMVEIRQILVVRRAAPSAPS